MGRLSDQVAMPSANDTPTKTATKANRTAKTTISTQVFTRLAAGPPNTPPIMLAMVKAMVSGQSTTTSVPMRDSSPLIEATTITTSEVPDAVRIGTPSTKTSTGTTTNPPPTPKKPVSRPVAEASALIGSHFRFFAGRRRTAVTTG